MILNYEFVEKKLNEIVLGGSNVFLLEKIVKNPKRYIGVFRPSKPRTKLIQNITQSREIKFGDALESIFEEYFKVLGFEILEKKLLIEETQDNNEYDIDQLLRKNGNIYLIEQKVRDDHDSTKKKGQFLNFKTKYLEVAKKYKKNTVIPIMWFIDDSLKKNRKYYVEQMEKMANSYHCNPKLYYGIQMFSESENGIEDFPNKIWEEMVQYLKRWRKTLPDMPSIKIEEDNQEVLEELKRVKLSIYKKLLKNQEIKEQIFPIIFEQGVALKKLSDFFFSKKERAYQKVAEQIEEYLSYYSQLSEMK